MAIIRPVLHLIAALISNNTQFSREWKEHPADSSSGRGEPDSIEGQWTGTWHSSANGHQGELKGIFRKVSESKYDVLFRATFAKVLKVSYQVILDAREQDEHFELSGSTDLGWLAGGVYRYQGTADSEAFSCHYECKYDQGEFALRRMQ